MENKNNNIGIVIAGTALAVFCLVILLCFITALLVPSATGDNWDAVFALGKDGFLLLGGVISTVIGHYFGTRSGEKAAEQAREDAHEAREALRSMGHNTGGR